MDFLEYYKQILQKVSFDHYLLRKEYFKACRYLKPQEKHQFHCWLEEQPFYYNLQKVIEKPGNKPERVMPGKQVYYQVG
ncbi:MAG: hypothetical protein ACLFUB_16955 [Cyclobacteriaceae bacterium]